MTREQRLLEHAIRNVSAIGEREAKVKEGYGRLCHKFPVLIRTCGLCQTLAFMASKVDEKRPQYDILLGHARNILQETEMIDGGASDLLEKVRNMGTEDYLHSTRLLLRAWVYHKRLAESVLKVCASDPDEDVE